MAYFHWDITLPDPAATALVIECRTYSNPGDIVWIDALTVEYPPGATVVFPEAGPSAVENTSWGSIKVLYR
jgi:hypothetical protein